MINFKIVIPGNCIVKKNTVGQLWYRTVYNKSTGLQQKIPLSQPITYYQEAYQKWAKSAIQFLGVFKNNLNLNNGKLPDGTPLQLPIAEPVVLTCVFFLDRMTKVDISNLIEAPQDVLAGNAGNFMDSVRTVSGVKHKVPYNHDTYRILADDNKDIVKNLGGSTILYDPRYPRTEIFITSFDFANWKKTMDILHPGLKLNTSDEEAPQLNLDLGGLYDGII